MPASYVYKAEGERGKKGIFLTPQEDPRSQPFAVLPDGRRIPGQYLNTNEGRHQYLFGPDILGQQGVKIEYNNQTIDLEDSNKSYEGSNPFDGWAYRAKGDLGSGGGSTGSGSYPGGFAPGNIGYGAFPAYLGDLYPDPFLIKPVPYKYTDPFEFSAKYGAFSRDEVTKNAAKAKELALDQLNTELEGLQAFAPAAGALKRTEIEKDNIFNQLQRTQQLQQVFPNLQSQFGEMEGDLAGQRKRAQAFAEGRAPDEITDRGLELTLRSRAADRASASGFSGLAADKISDLMSAETRIGLSQYGDQLLTSNLGARSSLINQRAALELAPTSYSDAGAQIRTTPSVSGASLAQGNLGQLNQLSMLSASQAFAGEIGQQQYISNQEFARRQINTGTQNQFALGKFAYDVGYAGTLAGALQTDINTGVGFAQQAIANEAALQAQGQAQDANTVGAIAAGIGTIASAIPTIAGALGIGGTTSAPSGYTGAGAVNVGGVGYAPGTSYGGSEGSIYVPAGQAIPSGYQGIRPTPDGGVIAVPRQGSSSTGTSSGPSYNQGQSGAEFDTSSPPSPPVSDVGTEDSGPYVPPPGTVQDPDTGTSYFPEDFPDGPPSSVSDASDVSGTRTARAEPARLSDAQAQKFQEETGLGVSPEELPFLSYSGKSVLSDAGIHYQPSQVATVNAGIDTSGKNLYGDPAKMSVTDPKVGSDYVNSFFDTFLPMNIFSTKDVDALKGIAQAAGNVALIDRLNTMWQEGDTKGFINTIAQTFKKPIINNITDDPKSRQGLNTAFSAYNLFQNWDRMSAGQKGLGLASVGLQGFQYATGENLALKEIVSPTFDAAGNRLTPGLTVGQSLQLFQQGYNVYSMVDNWNDLNTIQKIAQGTNNVAGMAELGKQFGLLGSGTGGSAVNITASQLAAKGFTAAPAYGVGGVTAPAGTALPAGYTQVATLPNGSIAAVPQANAGTAAAGVGTLQAVAGGAAIAAGAYQVYQGWGTGGKAGAINGGVGGLAISGGLMALGYTNPYLLGGVMAVSLIGNMAKTGKHEDQMARDSVRSVYQKAGLADKDYNVVLADGTPVNIGVDGSGGKHSITNRSLLGANHKDLEDLSSYDVDYTNDLDYVSSMGGITLSRLLSGGNAENITQMGGQLGNAALGNIGFGKQMTQDNFNKMVQNQKAFFSQAGIKSKEDAVQLINLAEAEKRLSATDAVTSRQAINILFDKDGYQLAQKLMSGRQRGADVAGQVPSTSTVDVTPKQPELKAPSGSPSNVLPVSRPTFNGSTRFSPLTVSKEEIRARNASRYSGGMSLSGV